MKKSIFFSRFTRKKNKPAKDPARIWISKQRSLVVCPRKHFFFFFSSPRVKANSFFFQRANDHKTLDSTPNAKTPTSNNNNKQPTKHATMGKPKQVKEEEIKLSK
jgi:hypothetical protein